MIFLVARVLILVLIARLLILLVQQPFVPAPPDPASPLDRV